MDAKPERLFIGIPLTDDARHAIAAALPKNLPGKPHPTLSRIDPPASVSTLLAGKPRFSVRMTVDSLLVYRSRLGGGPARYEEIVKVSLGL